MGPRHLILLASSVLLALGAAVAPTASAADFEWNAEQELSQGNQRADTPQVAIANDGSAVAVWRQNDGCRERLWAAYRGRGENFDVNKTKPPVIISQISNIDAGACNQGPLTTVGRFDLAMNARGDAIVVMEKVTSANGQNLIRSLFKPAGGRFDPSTEQTVANTGVGGTSLVEPKASIEGSGRATAIWHGPAFPFNDHLNFNGQSVYNSSTRGPGTGGIWSNDSNQQLLPHGDTEGEFGAEYNQSGGTIASNEYGDRLAALTDQRYQTQDGRGRQLVHAVQRNAGAPTWTDLGPADYPNHGPDLQADGLNTAIRGGAVMLSWRELGRIYGSHEAGPQLLADNNPFFNPPSQPSFDLDASGNALGLWTEAGPTNGGIYGAYSARGGAPGFEPVDGSPVPGDHINRPRTDVRLSTGRSDTAAAVFEEQCGPPSGTSCGTGAAGDDQVVRAAIRPPGAKTKFDAPATISGAGDMEPTTSRDPVTGPRIAINANGEGVAIWSQLGGVSGGDQIVRVALLTPTKPTASGEIIPLPPPPPPPPPPLPTSIEVARKLERGDAVVLTSNVSAPVTSLQWSFGTKGEPKIVSTAGANGRVPLSIRLRHPSRSFTARLTASGPGGSRTFTRTLTTPKPPDTSVARKISDGLNKTDAAGVFATGDAAGLLSTASAARASRRARGPKAKASASCSPISIFSGLQKLTGCFRPVEKLADIPAPEKGAITQLASSLKLDGSSTDQMNAATKLTDSYVSDGKALLNDKFPVTPSQAASVVSMPQADTLFSAQAEIPIGGAGGKFNPKDGLNLKLDPTKAQIPLGKLPTVPKLPSLAGLEIVGDWDVNLEKQEAKIVASVKLPPSITKSGVQISNRVNLTATPDRVVVDEVQVGPIDVNIKALKVDKFQIQYKRQPNQWDGQGKACLIGTACLDMIPPNGGVTIKNGDLERAGASLFFPPPGLPLWTGVNLERVGFGLGLRPTRIFGNARVGALQFIKLDGRIFVALPTSAEPFVMNRNEVGNDFPPHLYGSKFHRFTFGASAAALVDVPVIGETKLGGAYVVYEYPGYFAFGGGYDATVLDLVGIRGGVSAEGDAERGVFDIHGEVKACLYLADLDLCSGATGHVSRGERGTGGGGACVDLGLVTVGGGVKWNDLSDPYIWPIDGCRWSPFRIQVRQSAAAARAKGKGPKASATQLVRGRASRAVLARESQVGVSQAGRYTIKVEKDKPFPVLRLDGVGTAPAIRVSGPGGVLEAPAGKGFVKTPDNKMRIMRYQGRLAKITSIGFQNAAPGTYTVDVLPGSSPVVSVRQATDPPAAKVKGKVSGKGRNRVFTYEVARRPAQKVVFSELTASGASQKIGETSGGKGRIRFRSAPGAGRRTILAQFNLDGISAERKRVTTFKPQSPVMARPRGIKVSRKGSRLRVSWKRVSGATAYEVAVAPASKRMVFARTRGRRATLKLPGWDSGRVTVRALDDLRQSPTAGRRFKAIQKRPSPFRTFPRCKVTKKKINCGKSKAKAKSKSKAKKKSGRKG